MEMQTTFTKKADLLEVIELPFIEANTIPMDFFEMQQNHIIPVFTKDNQALISQHEFINEVNDIVSSMHQGKVVGPFIRVSHPIKGRIPSARYKKVEDLLPEEETIYYERMMFVFVIPSIIRNIDGKELKLVIGGIKSYNKDNFNRKGNSPQHFSFFIGFQVKVCSNLCIWTDGAKECIQVNTLYELRQSIMEILGRYNPEAELAFMNQLQHYELDMVGFAHLLGKCKLYNYLPKNNKTDILPCGLNDSQLNVVSRLYFQDTDFAINDQNNISLWSMYNLFTSALKSSYIDTYMDHHLMVGSFFKHLATHLEQQKKSFYVHT